MWKRFCIKIAEWIAFDYIDGLKKNSNNVELRINQRVAEVTSGIDPLDLILKDYNAIYSQDFDDPEENLNEVGKIGMYMWGWQQSKDPYFEHMVNWIIDSAGNETMKRAPITKERTQYGRAQMSNMILFKKQVGRLSSLYEEYLDKHKPQGFDPSKTVED